MKAKACKKRVKRHNPDTKTIKKLLIDLDLTVADLGAGYGCTPQMVSLVIHGNAKSKELEKHIARRLRRPLRDLFPQRRSAKSA